MENAATHISKRDKDYSHFNNTDDTFVGGRSKTGCTEMDNVNHTRKLSQTITGTKMVKCIEHWIQTGENTET